MSLRSILLRTFYNAVLLVIGAGIMVAFIYRTDPQRLADRVANLVDQPYAVLEIVPDSLQENWIAEGEGDRGRWVLAYTTRVIEKRQVCEEILIRRRLERLGDPRPVAENTIPQKQLVPVTSTPVIATGQAMLLPSMLMPADYIFTLEITCFQREPGGGILTALTPPAKAAPLCFRVPGIDPMRPRAPISMLPLRCQDQLTTVRVKVSGNPTPQMGQR